VTFFNPDVMKQILSVTCDILRTNFFYEEESLGRFLDLMSDVLGEELDFFQYNAEPAVLEELYCDSEARLYFTCYFVSAHLREVFIHDLHFTEQELHAFESILPKYTGVYHEKQQSKHKRAYYRKFFK
jgi:hypothetical protein